MTLAGIKIALQHAAFSTDQHLLCRVASVCKEWNASVQQADTRALKVQVSKAVTVQDSQPADMSRLISFTSWITKYASLVHSISIQGAALDERDAAITNQLFVLSLQSYTAAAGSIDAASSSAQQLHSYSSNIFYDRAVLRALSVATLAHLDLSNVKNSSIAALASGLLQLPNLQLLQIRGPNIKSHVLEVEICIPAITQLSRLKALTLEGVDGFHIQQLPVQLQELTVVYAGTFVAADFSHMTNLTRLSLDNGSEYSEYSGLPAQLQELQVDIAYGCKVVSYLDLTALKQLRKLTILHCYDDAQDLLSLRALPHLQHLALAYNHWSAAEAAAGAWTHLQQLQSLALEDDVQVDSFQRVLQRIVTITG